MIDFAGKLLKRPRHIIFIFLIFLPLIILILIGNINQTISYHDFSDKRAFLGVPNFYDVISNIFFLIVGFFGLIILKKREPDFAYSSWIVFSLGVILIAPGSAFYHLNPNNYTLVWDRIPMVIAFMGLFSLLVSEFINNKIDKYLLPVSLALGCISVIYWYFSDDLRFYIWIQTVPILSSVMLLIMFNSKYTHQYYLIFAVAVYLIAKVFELNDENIFYFTNNIVSGHTIKHVLASVSIGSIFRMLKIRKYKNT